MIIAYLEIILTIIHSIILSLVYSAILLIVILIISKISKAVFLSGIKTNKMKFWTSVAFVLFIVCISYRFSYRRDDGLGETVQVPIGYDQHVFCSDGVFVYFWPVEDSNGAFNIGHFVLKGNKLCAEAPNDENSEKADYAYIIYNIETRKIKSFDTVGEYSEYAQLESLPLPNEFKDFTYYYRKFTAKPEWKKWLLP